MAGRHSKSHERIKEDSNMTQTKTLKLSNKYHLLIDEIVEKIGMGATKKGVVERIIENAYQKVIVDNLGMEGLL